MLLTEFQSDLTTGQPQIFFKTDFINESKMLCSIFFHLKNVENSVIIRGNEMELKNK